MHFFPGSIVPDIVSAVNGNSEPSLDADQAKDEYLSPGARIREPNDLMLGPIRGCFDSHLVKMSCLGLLGFTLAVALGVFVAAVVCGIREAQAQTELAEGDRLVEMGQFAAAVPKLTAALQGRLPRAERPVAYGNRGWAETKLDRDVDAIADFNEALKIQPNLVFALLDRGLAFHRRGEFQRALEDYDATIRLNSNEVDAYRNRALILAHKGQFKEAIADMDEAIRSVPGVAAYYVARANFYLSAGELDSARASFESAKRIDPENANAYWQLSRIFAFRNDPARGLAEVSAAISLRPASAELYFARGLIEIDAAEYDRAASDFDEALKLKPGFALAYANRALIEFEYGRNEAATAFAALALKLDPKLAYPHFIQGRVHELQGDYEQAIVEFQQAITSDPGYIWPLAWRALTEAHSGNYRQAQREFAEMIQTFPGNYESHLVYAWFLATCPDPDFRSGPTAIAEARLAANLSPNKTEVLDTLAAAYAQAGDFARARELEILALEKLPKRSRDRQRFASRLAEYQHDTAHRDFH